MAFTDLGAGQLVVRLILVDWGRRTLAPKQFGCSASSMSSSEERSIPEAAPLPCQHLPCETRIVDLREVVDHNGDGGGIEDLLEETEDRLSVITHGESEVAFDISLELNHIINCNVPGQMTIEWVAPASAASLVSSMVVAADPPECQL